MKKTIIVVLIFLISDKIEAQYLSVPQVIQEQNQWCWAGVSKCILDFYKDTLTQCEIADYARTASPNQSYGTVNCCIDPLQGCNNWNYAYGYLGSIQDILINFKNIQNTGISSTLNIPQITTEIMNKRPFVVRWGWYSGGGHFVVGHGINGSNIYYMNPWFGEGLHISTYNWLVDDGNHTWTHTNVLNTNPPPTGLNTVKNENNFINVFPIPTNNEVTFSFKIPQKPDFFNLIITDLYGKKIFNFPIVNNELILSKNNLNAGIYFYQLINNKEIIAKGKFIFN